MAKLALAGDGTNRWFDKSNTLEIWKDTTMGGANMEHSGADATVSCLQIYRQMSGFQIFLYFEISFLKHFHSSKAYFDNTLKNKLL